MDAIQINRAEEQDLQEVLNLAEASALENTTEQGEQKSFLVSAFDIKTYRDMLQRASYFWVVREEGRLVAFLLAYTHDEIPPKAEVDRLVLERSSRPFVITKQVCVAADRRGSRIAERLYRRLIDQVRPWPVWAAVVAEPPNVPSMRLHARLGFTFETAHTPSDGLMRYVYRYAPDHSASRVDALTVQHETVVQQYMHEDSLNWQKAHHMVYTLAGLLLLMSYLLGLRDGQGAQPDHVAHFLTLVWSLGAIALSAFLLLLRSGTNYLLERKQCATNVDCALAEFSGVRTMSDQLLGHSPSAVILRRAPIAAVVLWFLVLVFLLLGGKVPVIEGSAVGLLLVLFWTWLIIRVRMR